jgi:anti-sigma regulatory factor (Ser/Thr protein kinase)
LALKYLGDSGKPTNAAIAVELKNDLSEIERLKRIVDEFARRHQIETQALGNMNLALDEILTNIISYGYDDGGEQRIVIRLALERGKWTVEVEDDGKPFNPLNAPVPDTKQLLEERPIGGLGIHLVRKLVDALEYRRHNDRNILVMKLKVKEA